MADSLFMFNFDRENNNMTLINKIKQNASLYFVFKLVRFLIIVFILDFSIGHTLKYFYLNLDSGRQYRSLYTIEETKADILILGPSQAYNNYVPDILEARLKQTCYNAGTNGEFILYEYAVLKAVEKRYSPKLIFLNIIPGEFRVEKDTYDRLSFLLPLYKRDTAIQPIVDLKGPFEKYKLLSSIYPYNSLLVILAASNTEYYKKGYTVEKGYQAETDIWDKPLKSTSPEPYPLDPIKINIFKSFLDECQHAGTKLVVVCSPSFIDLKCRDLSILTAEEIAKERNVLFLDFTNDTLFLNRPYLFNDPHHLNREGSQEFTKILADKISVNQ
jgi:hypothetical protein